jgi:hypothetical protein
MPYVDPDILTLLRVKVEALERVVAYRPQGSGCWRCEFTGTLYAHPHHRGWMKDSPTQYYSRSRTIAGIFYQRFPCTFCRMAEFESAFRGEWWRVGKIN